MASDPRPRPTVTKRLFLWLVIAAVAALALLLFVMRPLMDRQEGQPDSVALRNLTVSIDDQSFDLKDGVAELPAAPGSAARNTLRMVGDPVSGDVNGDGRPDAALLLRNDAGGSGTFYYAVLAVNDGGSYHATNAVALGDRIAPESVNLVDGRFVYRFLERKPGEPLSAEPTVQKSVGVSLDPASGRISAVR